MKCRKNKSIKYVRSKGVNNFEKAINTWDVINEKFANINETCKILTESIQNLSVNTKLMNENLKSQTFTSNRIINDTAAKLRKTRSNLKIARINDTSLKRTIHADNDNSKKIPGFPIGLPN